MHFFSIGCRIQRMFTMQYCYVPDSPYPNRIRPASFFQRDVGRIKLAIVVNESVNWWAMSFLLTLSLLLVFFLVE